MAVALPWLWPWAAPPVPAAPGLLVAWGFTALLWLCLRWRGPHVDKIDDTSITLPLLLLALGFAAWHMPVLDLALLGGWAGSLLCMGVAARCLRHGGTSLSLALGWGLLAAACLSSVLGLWQYLGLLRTPDTFWTWLHASPQEEAFGQLRQRNHLVTNRAAPGATNLPLDLGSHLLVLGALAGSGSTRARCSLLRHEALLALRAL